MITRDPWGICNAREPWYGPDTLERPARVHTCDTPEQMEQCFACPLEDCEPRNCPWRGKTKKRKRERMEQEIVPLVRSGISVRAISERTGLSVHAVRYWIRKLGLRQEARSRRNDGSVTKAAAEQKEEHTP